MGANVFAILVLWASFPIIFSLFCAMPPRRAAFTSITACWLFMPVIGYQVPGLPDFSKLSVSSVGTLLCIAIFDASRLINFKIKWYDAPMLVFCVAPILTDVANGIGIYEGVSSSLGQFIIYGFPYFIGRLYGSDLEGIRELVMCALIGGLAYAPLCLFEGKFSPQLNSRVFGIVIQQSGFMVDNYRWYGYRPVVFQMNGLTVGAWMMGVAILALWLWGSGSVKTLFGKPFRPMFVLLFITSILCRSTGAVGLLLLGVAMWHSLKSKRAPALLMIFIGLPPLYMALRSTGLWSGSHVVDLTNRFLSEDRATSLQFRFDNENLVVEKAMQKPLLGWGGWRGRVTNKYSRDITVIDGFWVAIISDTGLVGLTSVTLALCLPQYLTLRRFPPRVWRDPEVAPATGAAVVVGLYFIDNLFNGTLNPIIVAMCGGLMGLKAFSPPLPRGTESVVLGVPELAAQMTESGQLAEAEELCHHAINQYKHLEIEGPVAPELLREIAAARNSLGAVLLASGRCQEAEENLTEAIATQEKLSEADPSEPVYRQELACSLNNLGHVCFATSRPAEAEQCWRRALDLEQALADEEPAEESYRSMLAFDLDHLGRVLHDQRRYPESLQVRRAAVETWATLARQHRGYRGRWADGCNDLALSLCREVSPGPGESEAALRLALDATALIPENPSYWKTLGLAYYRAEAYKSASDVLERSASFSGGGTGFELFVLAMAYAHLGHHELAEEYLRRGDDWMATHQSEDADLLRLRAEAAGLLGSLALTSAASAQADDGALSESEERS